MTRVVQVKDGRVFTVLSIRDIMEIVEDYAGHEVRQAVENYTDDCKDEAEYYEGNAKEAESDLEKTEDHQRAVMNDIREEIEAVEELLDSSRLNRKKIADGVNRVIRIVYNEL